MISAIGFGITVMVVLWLLFWIIPMFFYRFIFCDTYNHQISYR